jgi:hypothetical protein
MVNVNHVLGKIPSASSFTGTTTVSCTITSVSVTDNKLNLLGDNNVTFTGTNLPRDLSKSTVSITFNDN